MRSIATKIFLAFGVSLLAFALVSAFGIAQLHDLGRKLRLLSEGYLPLTRIAAQIDVKDWVTPRVLEAGALDPASRRALVPLARSRFPSLVREKIAEGRAVAGRAAQVASGEEAAFLAEVVGRLDALDAAWSRYDAAARALLDAAEAGEAPSDAGIQAARTMEKALAIDVKLLQAALESHTSELVLAAGREESRTVASIIIYTLLALSVGAGAALVSQRLLAPIRTLTEGVKGVASGDLSRQVEVRGSDELGVLAREFNAMAASLERQRQELLRAERLAAVGRISAHITHEIRNPLNSLGLNAELLADELEPGASTEARALLGAITREVDRLNAVAEEYLRFARLPRPVMAREDLNDVLRGLVDFVAPEMAAAGVTVTSDLAKDLPPVWADEGQLRAVFLNLLRNSREAMPGGGTIAVRTARSADGGAEVTVADTGSGIPPEQQDENLRSVLFHEVGRDRPRPGVHVAGRQGARRDDPVPERGEPRNDLLGMHPACASGRRRQRGDGERVKPTKRRSRRFRDPLRGHSPMAEGPFLLGQRARFANGARVVVARTPGLHSAMLALYVRAGSRHEEPEANGVSHFVEHLLFRGSRGYPDSRAMNAAVEAAGGSMNAMTARDHTCFYTSLHPAGLETGIDVITDLARHPLLRDIEVERQVILEEILDEVDSRGRDVDPDNLVKRIVFPGHGLGQKIAGSRGSVRALDAGAIRAHHARHYTGANVVLVAAGPISYEEVVEIAAPRLGAIHRGGTRPGQSASGLAGRSHAASRRAR